MFLKYLDDSPLPSNFENLSLSDWSISETNIDNFWELRELDIIKNNQRTLNLDYGPIVDSRGYIIISSDRLGIDIEISSLSHVLKILIYINK